MGDYNPYQPYILGMEWVPIQDSPITLTPLSPTEYGYIFTLSSPQPLSSVMMYLKEFTGVDPGILQSPTTGERATVSIYPLQAINDNTQGPVRKVTIPATSVQLTGAVRMGAQSSNIGGISIQVFPQNSPLASGSAGVILTGFDTVKYQTLLNDKRILQVYLSYRGYVADMLPDGTPVQFNNPNPQLYPVVMISRSPADTLATIPFVVPPTADSNTGALNLTTSPDISYKGINFLPQLPILTSYNVPGNASRGTYAPSIPTKEYQALGTIPLSNLLKLDRYNAVGGAWLSLVVRLPYTSGYVNTDDIYAYPLLGLYDMSLEIVYTEETRIMSTIETLTSGYIINGRIGAQDLLNGFGLMTTTVPAGSYAVTISSAFNPPELGAMAQAPLAPMNALRQLYDIPSITPVQLTYPNYSNPAAITGNDEVTTTYTQIIPQLTLHVSGSASFLSQYSQPPITDTHPYGAQQLGPVYSTFTVSQRLNDCNIPNTQNWPFIRFYARRYGATSIPLKVAVGSSTAYLTPAAFDALDQLTTENWREVTLEFDTAPSIGNCTSPTVTWSATGEQAASRWEILGVDAPFVTSLITHDLNSSGNSRDIYTKITHYLMPATYGGNSSTYSETSGAPNASPPPSSGNLPGTDAVVMLSQRPPTVTGFTLTASSQAVTGIGTICGVNPGGIPSEIYYNNLSWGNGFLPEGGIFDSFARITSNGWGSPEIGPASYSNLGVSPVLSTDGSYGYIESTATSTVQGVGLATSGGPNADAYVTITNYSPAITGASSVTFLVGISSDNGSPLPQNGYVASINVSATLTTMSILKYQAGVATTIGLTITTGSSFNGRTIPRPINNAYGSSARVRFINDNGWLKLKVWTATQDEPNQWTIQVYDADANTLAATGMFLGITHTNIYAKAGFSALEVTPSRFWLGYYEMQRRDEVETDWQTIMKATNPALIDYNDFEARVGVRSDYRIRYVNHYNFVGAWSTEVSGMVPSPGVYLSEALGEGHVLIFTTNQFQNGLRNLAYSSVWMGEVEESFTFPESDFVQMQLMYNRDFYTAFRPLERGGEQFERTVLVQAAAIAPETLADFTSLRDLAWDQIDYVCVRDEDGNRWFAIVTVPSGNVLRNRKLYLAPVRVVESTDTPTPVDPSPWS